MLDGVQGLTDRFRQEIRTGGNSVNEVLVHHLEALPKMQQTELAALIHSRKIRTVAVGNTAHSGEEESVEHSALYAPELDAELSSTNILLPALRDRNDDSAQWARHFIVLAAERLGVPAPSLSSRAIAVIIRYRWPGNLIELEAVVSRALCFSSSPSLEPSDLGLSDTENAILPLAEAVEQFHVGYVDRALAHFSGNRTQAARALGVDPRTVFRYLERRKK